MPTTNNTPAPGDPLFNLHHAEAEAELARQQPAATAATDALTGDDDTDDQTPTSTAGPVDSQGQRRGQPLSTPEMGSTAGHH